MKRNLFICVFILCTFLSLNAQWSGTDPVWTNSNVGIGTNTPSYKLQIQKASTSPAIMIGGGYAGSPRLQVYGLDADPNAWMGLGTDMAGGPYEHSIYFPIYGTYGFLTIGSYNGTSFSEKMRVLSNGNVGIGTTSPIAKLHIGTIADTQHGFRVTRTTNTADSWAGVFENTASSTEADLAGKTYSGIFMGGNVGIGTTTPGYLLEVSGNTSIGNKAFVCGQGNEIWTQPQTNSAATLFINYRGYADAYTQFRNTNICNGKATTIAYFDGINNKVGIGTTSPEHILDVIGTGSMNSRKGYISDGNNDGTGNAAYFPSGIYANATYNWIYGVTRFNNTIQDNNDNKWYIDINGNARFMGNVGIGTTNPQNMLDVNGTIRAHELKATLDGWSDYVFSDDYQLPPLKNVENFIKANKRLQDIPSAKKVAKDGINLGEMNAKLLKKVEELTLYVIELNKKIEKLESEKKH